jgi:hypothetical protein
MTNDYRKDFEKLKESLEKAQNMKNYFQTHAECDGIYLTKPNQRICKLMLDNINELKIKLKALKAKIEADIITVKKIDKFNTEEWKLIKEIEEILK